MLGIAAVSGTTPSGIVLTFQGVSLQRVTFRTDSVKFALRALIASIMAWDKKREINRHGKRDCTSFTNVEKKHYV